MLCCFKDLFVASGKYLPDGDLPPALFYLHHHRVPERIYFEELNRLSLKAS